MENILKILATLSDYHTKDIVVYDRNGDIEKYYEVLGDHIQEQSFLKWLDTEMLPIGWHETHSGELVNVTSSYATIRDMILNVNSLSIEQIHVLDNYKPCIYNGGLKYIDSVRFIEDIEKYNEQKKEEERIRLEKLKVDTVKNTVRDMIELLKQTQSNTIIDYNKQILNHIFFIKKSEGKNVPYFVHGERLNTCRRGIQGISLNSFNYDDIKTIYKQVKKDDYTKLDSYFLDKFVLSDTEIEVLENVLETEEITEEGIVVLDKSLIYYGDVRSIKKVGDEYRYDGMSLSRHRLKYLIHRALYSQDKYMGMRVKVGSRYHLLFGDITYTGMGTTNVDEFEIPTDVSKVRYQNSIKKNLEKENIKEIIKKYKEINVPIKEDIAQQKLEEIYTFDEVQEVVHDGENLCVYTKPLYINQYYSGEHRTQDTLIGRFIIKIGIATGNLSVFKNPRKTNGGQAPHIFREGHFCTGSFNDIMAEASRKLDYSALIYYILEHLRTYNSSSPVENLQSYISSIGNELVLLENEGYPITRPLTGFSVQPGGTPFNSIN